MDLSVGSSLRRGRSDADGGHSWRPPPLDRATVQRIEVSGVVSYSHSQPKGAEISMQNVMHSVRSSAVAAHSYVSKDFTHSAIDEVLRAELEGKVIDVPIEDFASAAFPGTYQVVVRSPPRNQQSEYVSAIEKYLQTVASSKDRWKIYQHFAALIDVVIMARYGSVRMVLLDGRYVKGSVKRKIPACFVHHERASATDINWEDILAPFHFAPPRGESRPPTKDQAADHRRAGISAKLKNRSRTGTSKYPSTLDLEPHEILAGYALEILSASGLRQHVFAVFVDNEAVSILYFDRSGVISSAEMNLHTDAGRESFYNVFGAFANANREDWGFVKRFRPCAGWPSTEKTGQLLLWNRNDQPQNWALTNLTRLNNYARGLLGRGTRVYSFGGKEEDYMEEGYEGKGREEKSPREKCRALYALKLSWQPVIRASEVDFFVDAEAAGVEGIPKILAADNLALLSSGLRGGLSSRFPQAVQGDRQLRALVFDRVCIPLQEYEIKKHPLGFLKIFKKLIIIHYDLCSNARILHRDITPHNLMWVPAAHAHSKTQMPAPDGEDEPISEDEAYLIDLDFAIPIPFGQTETTTVDDANHTHALPFLALDHLPAEGPTDQAQRACSRYFYRHDLESFFWSAWWILLSTVPKSERSERISGLLDDWSSRKLWANGVSKLTFLQSRHRVYTKLVSGELWPEHEHCSQMETFLNDMSSMFNKGYNILREGGDVDLLTAGDVITYNAFLDLFPV